MQPRQSAQERARSAAVNNKLAAGGAVTPTVAGTNFGISTVQLTVLVLAFGALCGAVLVAHHWLEQRDDQNYKRGLAAKQIEWDRANEAAAELERRRGAAVGRELLAADNARAAAETKAHDAEAKWEEARREARNSRRPSVVCQKPRSEDAAGAQRDAGPGIPVAGVVDHRPDLSGGPLLTWGFVLDFDAAWTGADGEPVFGAAAGRPEAAAAGAASPYSPDDALDVHGANARRCSEDRRELGSLIEKLERAQAAWDREQHK
jgi:hypothetical protein